MKTINWLTAMAVVAALASGAVTAYAQSMQQTIDQTKFDEAIGDTTVSHRWSQVAMVPPGSFKSVTAVCDAGGFPTGGGFALGGEDLQVLSSHVYSARNGTMGWTVFVTNSNATASLPASADVLCLSESRSVGTNDDAAAPPVVEQDQNEGLTIKTDKQSYSAGDRITITGTVADREAGSDVGIEIINSDGERDWLAFAPVFADKTYKLIIEAGEPENEFSDNEIDTAGTYLVTATYRTPDIDYIQADASFEYEG